MIKLQRQFCKVKIGGIYNYRSCTFIVTLDSWEEAVGKLGAETQIVLTCAPISHSGVEGGAPFGAEFLYFCGRLEESQEMGLAVLPVLDVHITFWKKFCNPHIFLLKIPF